MFRSLAIAAVFALAASGGADAATCRGPDGKIVNCPPAGMAHLTGVTAAAAASTAHHPVCRAGRRCAAAHKALRR